MRMSSIYIWIGSTPDLLKIVPKLISHIYSRDMYQD